MRLKTPASSMALPTTLVRSTVMSVRLSLHLSARAASARAPKRSALRTSILISMWAQPNLPVQASRWRTRLTVRCVSACPRWTRKKVTARQIKTRPAPIRQVDPAISSKTKMKRTLASSRNRPQARSKIFNGSLSSYNRHLSQRYPRAIQRTSQVNHRFPPRTKSTKRSCSSWRLSADTIFVANSR